MSFYVLIVKMSWKGQNEKGGGTNKKAVKRSDLLCLLLLQEGGIPNKQDAYCSHISAN